jgi:hypothetical protein
MVIKEAKQDKKVKGKEVVKEEPQETSTVRTEYRGEYRGPSLCSITNILLILLTICVALQVDYVVKLQSRLTQLEISFLEATAEVPESTEATAKVPESTEARHSPHSHYNVTLDKNGVPLDPLKEYHLNDFSSVFHVDPIFENVYTDEANKYLDTINVYEQDYYYDFEQDITENIDKCTAYLENLKHEDDFSLAVRWESKENGFGLIAKRDFAKGEIVGLYAGNHTLNPRRSLCPTKGRRDRFGLYVVLAEIKSTINSKGYKVWC